MGGFFSNASRRDDGVHVDQSRLLAQKVENTNTGNSKLSSIIEISSQADGRCFNEKEKTENLPQTVGESMSCIEISNKKCWLSAFYRVCCLYFDLSQYSVAIYRRV